MFAVLFSIVAGHVLSLCFQGRYALCRALTFGVLPCRATRFWEDGLQKSLWPSMSSHWWDNKLARAVKLPRQRDWEISKKSCRSVLAYCHIIIKESAKRLMGTKIRNIIFVWGNGDIVVKTWECAALIAQNMSFILHNAWMVQYWRCNEKPMLLTFMATWM